MKKTSIIILLLILFINCSKDDNIKILNTKSQLKYKKINSISSVDFKKRERLLDSLNYNFEYINRNDTIFLVTENNNNEKISSAWIYPQTKLASKLNCEKLIVLTSNEISFKFCHEDITSFFKKYDTKTDVRYLYLTRAINSLLKTKPNRDYNPAIFNDEFVSVLTRNIAFDIFDENEKLNIPKLYINEFDIGAWHGYDHFLINKLEDTIASFSYTDLHRSVDLRRIW